MCVFTCVSFFFSFLFVCVCVCVCVFNDLTYIWLII